MLSLDEKDAVDIGYVGDLHRLLAAIEATMPEEAVLYVEGTSISDDIKAFLDANRANEAREVERGTAWPRPATYHLPATRKNLTELRELAEQHAGPEVCNHLVVYHDDRVLVAAYDAGEDNVYVHRDLRDEILTRLRRAARRS